MGKGFMKREKCKGCKKGYKTLSDDGFCFHCKPDKWRHDRRSVSNKGGGV